MHAPKRIYLTCACLLLISILAQAQTRTISGRVVDDSTRGPLEGVTITEIKTGNSVSSNMDGQFSLVVNSAIKPVLVFSSVGYAKREVVVEDESTLNITLEKSTTNMEEVVVLGYGSQKRSNITGAVATITGAELTQRPVNNVATLLQGKLAGVYINQGSAQPGKEQANIFIRGAGTFSGAGNNPLVIIDGIAGSLDKIDPMNIESISVLKDAASSSIYGARAANGVIVVTTKMGSNNSFDVSYGLNYGRQSATVLPDFIWNSVEYMEMWNKAHLRQGIPNLFEQSTIDAYKNAAPNDPQYPNFNWVDYVFRNTPAVRNTVVLSGGTERSRFYAQLGVYDQQGMVIGHNFRRYTGQLNFESKLNDWLTFGTNLYLTMGKRKEPWLYDSDFILLAYGSQPMFTPYLPDGKRYSHGLSPDKWVNRNPEFVANEGGRFLETQNIRALSYLNVKILPELTWHIKGSIDYTNNFHKEVQYPIETFAFATGQPYSDGWLTRQGVSDSYQNDKMPTFYSTLNYNKTFGNKHNIGLLAGYNQEYFFTRNLGAYRRDFTFPILQQINAGGTDGQATSGTASEWAIQSYFGRATYNYDSKYFFEANVRYDGTSRIHESNRWGMFPSVSAGWRLSEENFMQQFGWLDNLKLRASWGKLGNQNIGNYPYQDVLGLARYPLGSSLNQGAIQTRLTDKDLRWETTTSSDIGVEMSVLKGLFSLEFDWYLKSTDGILAAAQIPASVGLSAPTVNYASMDNKGIELLLGHRNKIGEVSYSVSVNYSANRNKVTKVFAPNYGLQSVVEGQPINAYYMIEWDGIFQSQEEIDAAPTHQGSPQPGDLRFKDLSGPNGKPDMVIDAYDRTFVGNVQPKYTYGGTVNVEWRNWDVSAFFQGVQGSKQYLTWWAYYPFTQGTPPTTDWRNAWTPENKSQTMPALWSFSTYGYTPMSGTDNTFYLQDASYVRLKNIRVGYTLPRAFLQKIRLKQATVYFSGDNLFTSTDMKYIDPERVVDQWWSTRGSVYPQAKTVSFGLDVKF